ncbi:hypothetical protein D915_007757 [Fasciola hepatica]|uniref:Uncharacterized protein n=1 Tax=Fasciola hepatica TaxID=6192 RepID=A0A4E0R0C2_FASHE|nr:hypothetical protein D915_007757 [Fasciola hepatica]
MSDFSPEAARNAAITEQPRGIVKPEEEREWSNTLFGCCDDMSSCKLLNT